MYQSGTRALAVVANGNELEQTEVVQTSNVQSKTKLGYLKRLLSMWMWKNAKSVSFFFAQSKALTL